MMNMLFTKLTTKGQIIIPKEIRNSLHLVPGTKFKVSVKEKEIILHPIADIEFEKLKVSIPEGKVSEFLKESKKLEMEREKQLLNALGIA